MLQYAPILIYGGVSIMIAIIIIIASYILGSTDKIDAEKVSVYECGFNPYGDSRQKFEIRFFLVGILFIIFDLEISFLFPWSSTLYTLADFAYWTMYIFLFILTIGLVYEWNKGGLDWE